jgi:cytoskeleton protein RodZ
MSPSIVARTTTPLPQPPEPTANPGEAIPAAETTAVAPASTESEAAAAPPPSLEDGQTVADAAEPDGVVFEFSGPCWVDIRDSTKKFKLFGEMQKGDRHVLGGIPPYSVILGNSPMVQISVKGKELDLAALSRGNVARFTLDPNSLD